MLIRYDHYLVQYKNYSLVRILQHCKMRGHHVSIFLLLALSKGLATTQLPRFQAYWESQLSYLYNDDELSNPWHIDLGKSYRKKGFA